MRGRIVAAFGKASGAIARAAQAKSYPARHVFDQVFGGVGCYAWRQSVRDTAAAEISRQVPSVMRPQQVGPNRKEGCNASVFAVSSANAVAGEFRMRPCSTTIRKVTAPAKALGVSSE